MATTEHYRTTSILNAYEQTIQRILFLCFSGSDIKEIEREAICVSDFVSAVKAAQSDGEIEVLVASQNAK